MGKVIDSNRLLLEVDKADTSYVIYTKDGVVESPAFLLVMGVLISKYVTIVDTRSQMETDKCFIRLRI